MKSAEKQQRSSREGKIGFDIHTCVRQIFSYGGRRYPVSHRERARGLQRIFSYCALICPQRRGIERERKRERKLQGTENEPCMKFPRSVAVSFWAPLEAYYHKVNSGCCCCCFDCHLNLGRMDSSHVSSDPPSMCGNMTAETAHS